MGDAAPIARPGPSYRLRHASVADAEALLPLTRALHHSAGYSAYAPWDDEKWREWLEFCAHTEAMMCMIAEDTKGRPLGVVTAFLVPSFWDKDVVIAHENILWVVPEVRGNGIGRELMKSLIEWGRENGAMLAATCASQHMAPRSTGALYRDLGFELEERAYMRRV